MGLPGLNKWLWQLQKRQDDRNRSWNRLQPNSSGLQTAPMIPKNSSIISRQTYCTGRRAEPPKLPSGNINCEFLFIDMDQVLHESITALESDCLFFEDVDSRALNRLKEILECTNPSKFVFIAYDGVPPLAKLQHVRKMWFINSKDRTKAIISPKQQRQQQTQTHNTNNQNTDSQTLGPLLFDRNNIAPGTEFMRINSEKVLRYMEQWKACNSSAESNHKVDFHWSTSLEPGEGENKIINFIRNKDFTEMSSKGDRLIIYSADGDLVMLSAMLDLPLLDIELLKKLEIQNLDFCDAELVNINALRNALLDLLIHNCRGSDKFNNIVIECWVFACYLAGNDFIPKIEEFNDFFTSLGCITDALSHYLSIFGRQTLFINNDHSIDAEQFLEFLKIILMTFQNEFNPNLKQIKLNYHGLDNQSRANDNKTANDYLFMLKWLHEYYRLGHLNAFDKFIQYPLDHGPCTKTLIDFLERRHSIESIRTCYSHFPRGAIHEYLDPLSYLVLIMPIRSIKILPDAYQEAIVSDLKSRRSYLNKFYRKEYHYERGGERYLSQAKFFMPHIKYPHQFLDYITSLMPQDNNR